MLRALLVLILVGGSMTVVAGCGGDSDSESSGAAVTQASETEAAEEESTAVQALAAVQAIPALLDAAVARYASGEHQAAADTVGDVYLEHYEKVEGPLGDVNHDLMEELEEKISTDLRTAMEDGKPQADIDAMVADIKTQLQQAEEELG